MGRWDGGVFKNFTLVFYKGVIKLKFIWEGKDELDKILKMKPIGVLRHDKASSKNWDTTENLYIEGDNL